MMPVTAVHRQHLEDLPVSDRPTLTYDQLADRIEQELGVRPATSSLRAVAHSRRRRRTAVTAGMPAPEPTRDTRRRTVFDADAIDTWLAQHPHVQIRRLQQRITAAPLARRTAVVAAAREAGLSWQHIADACAAADGRSYTKQWAQQRFGKS